jgi:arabinogalactan endo-1,4-beta-galactosidase
MPSILSVASAALLCLSTANASPHKPVQTQTVDPFFYKGFDLSSLHILELGNVTYKDTARRNATRPAEDILGDGGMNTVRLRYVAILSTGSQLRETDTRYDVGSGSIPTLDNTIWHIHCLKLRDLRKRAIASTSISTFQILG